MNDLDYQGWIPIEEVFKIKTLGLSPLSLNTKLFLANFPQTFQSTNCIGRFYVLAKRSLSCQQIFLWNNGTFQPTEADSPLAF